MQLSNKALNMMARLVIALDGPAASGKGSVARLIAKRYNLIYFQSSLMYRGLAYLCLQKGIGPDDINAICSLAMACDIASEVKNIDLNNEKIGFYASKIATIEPLRSIITKNLRSVIEQNPRIIMEGRDIGSVVAPDADLKIFLTADVKTRAERRYKQLLSEGKECMLSEIFASLQKRDEMDQSRAVAPLVKAKDAYVIDSTDLSEAQVMAKLEQIIEA